ncbi:uncharacterized protein LOC128960790 [Oppia nitens]|uniref:uncharacterized protein LOC128960790 n=1 Tax=Oppia nitens TaxID=1686743 RepID=UPI0023DA9F66|nr:uncharacterized protein LOC128960790 [Oppia nitens]
MYNNNYYYYLSSSVVVVLLLASTICLLVQLDMALAADDCGRLETDLKGCLVKRWDIYSADKIAAIVANGSSDSNLYPKIMVCSSLETHCANKKLAKKCKDVRIESKQEMDIELEIAAKSGFIANEANCKKLNPSGPVGICSKTIVKQQYLPCLSLQ